jgi:hypothetical protein
MNFEGLAAYLERTAQAIPPMLPETAADWDAAYPGSSEWTRRELLGHLVDSAINNQQRFVRACLEGELRFPSYDQTGMVRVQRYREAPIELRVPLWQSLNRQIARIFVATPVSGLAVACCIGTNPAMTYEQMALDYVAHLDHHLKQLVGTNALEWSGLPWPPEERWQDEIRAKR